MKRRLIAAACLALVSAQAAAAQSWESPTFFSPGAHDEIGLHLIDAEGSDLGFMAIWRQSGNIHLGVRGGIGGRDGDRSVLVGAEFYGPLVVSSASQRFAVSWIVGAGAAFDGVTWLRVPAGVSIGADIATPSFTITPYAHPRVSFDLFAFDLPNGEEQTDSEINFDIDLGADLRLGQSWIARVGITVGEFESLGLGLAYRIPRRASVR